ncbi:MAG: bifunctional hydroxymethylpyrimidine kinase/phosphomethylpyrimidine kinase [Bacteroidaceae bacterium]|nr:bifunctional hydroxymethylpyrimidine kinase/phosphomethylpyrimidine kinase [Bacteroidaceae bacterium]
MKHYTTVLTIAGSDSGGGAGIQADIKTISALGCYATTAITAITVQNTVGVEAVHPVPVDFVKGQIEAVLSDIGADAVKIGMLQSAEIVRAVAEMLRKYKVGNVVLDPVMVSTSGHRLIEEEAIDTLRRELIPLARVITPNIPEAEILLGGEEIRSQASLPEMATRLSASCGVSVLLKAGHLSEDELTDILYDKETDKLLQLTSKRIRTRNTHGTGCTMSSALAASLAKGETLQQAASSAKTFISNAIIAGADYEIGHGHGPVQFLAHPCT